MICNFKFKISIIDKLTRSGHSAIVKFHLHPDIDISCNNENKCGVLILPNGNKIEWIAECEKIYIEDSEYASEFGILNKTKTLLRTFLAPYLNYYILWAGG